MFAAQYHKSQTYLKGLCNHIPIHNMSHSVPRAWLYLISKPSMSLKGENARHKKSFHRRGRSHPAARLNEIMIKTFVDDNSNVLANCYRSVNTNAIIKTKGHRLRYHYSFTDLLPLSAAAAVCFAAGCLLQRQLVSVACMLWTSESTWELMGCMK